MGFIIYLCVLFLQFGEVGMSILTKSSLNQHLNHFTFSIYRNTVSAVIFGLVAVLLERGTRPKMTMSIWIKIMFLGLLGPVIHQNLLYSGMKYTTASFGSAMSNILPSVTFLMAWALKLENVNVKEFRSQAKIVGTLVTLGGAMIMTFVKGPNMGLPWMKHNQETSFHLITSSVSSSENIKGSIMITVAFLSLSCFSILQAITLKSYPAALSLTSLICFNGAWQGSILTLIVEKNNFSIWHLYWDTKLVTILYAGIIISGVNYYISLRVIKKNGPLFVTSFNPLTMIIVVIYGYLFLSEQMNVGKIVGAVIICLGLFSVIWGKSKDGENISSKEEDTHIIPPVEENDNCENKETKSHQNEENVKSELPEVNEIV